MKYNSIPKKSDRSINFDAWVNVCAKVRKITNLKFDPTIFWVQDDPTGVYVTMYPPATEASATQEDHFKVADNTSGGSLSVVVHGGSWYDRKDDEDTRVTLTCDTGYSGKYEDVKSITPSEGDNYIYLECTREPTTLAATTLEAKVSATFPPEPTNDNEILTIAYVNVVSGVVTDIEQYTDGDFKTFFKQDDDLMTGTPYHSISQNGYGRDQLYGFEGATTSALECEDLIVFKDTSTETIKYVGSANFETYINSCISIDSAGSSNTSSYANTSGYASAANTCSYANTAGTVISIPPHAHSDHSGLDADDHLQYLLLSGDATRNAMSGIIGDAGGTQCISPPARELYDSASQEVLDWENQYLLDGGGNTRVDWSGMQMFRWDGSATRCTLGWYLCHLYGDLGKLSVDWLNRMLYDGSTVDSAVALNWELRTLNDSNADVVANWGDTDLTMEIDAAATLLVSSANVASSTGDGALQVVGGIGADHFYVDHGTVNNGTEEVRFGINPYAVDAITGGINCANVYSCGGVGGYTDTSGDWCLVHQSTGALLPVKIRGGILCIS